MTQQAATNQSVTNISDYFDRMLYLNKIAFEQKERDIKSNETIFRKFQKDIDALTLKDIYINPVLDRAYLGRGVIRLTVPAYTVEFQNRICYALISRGYDDTSDSTKEVRVLKRDSVYFIITIEPFKKSKG